VGSAYDIDWYQIGKSTSGSQFAFGEFYWALVPFVPVSSVVDQLVCTRDDPVQPGKSRFKVVSTNVAGSIPENKLRPVRSMKTSQGEMLVIVTCKSRPVIVVGEGTEPWQDGAARQGDDAVLVAPVYSVRDEAREYKYAPAFLERVQALQYPSLFYLPECELMTDGLVRLDRVLSLPKYLSKGPFRNATTHLALSEDASLIFRTWFHIYLGGDLPEDLTDLIEDYQQDKLAQLQRDDLCPR